MHGMDASVAIAADGRVFVTLEARAPILATTVQALRNYAPRDMSFGMRYADAVDATEDGVLTVDLTRIGAMEPDSGGEHREQGWTEREEEAD
jgi:hypothetical protein